MKIKVVVSAIIAVSIILSCSNQSQNNSNEQLREQEPTESTEKFSYKEANKVFKDLYFGISQDSVYSLGYSNEKDTTLWVYESTDPTICGITFDDGLLFFEDHKLFEVAFAKTYKTEEEMKVDANKSKLIFEAKYGKANEEMLEDLLLEIPDEQQFYKWDILHKHIMSTISCSQRMEYKLEISIVDSVRAGERDARILRSRVSEI